uniref:Uncharacterized protein n=1 Tax=Amphora coffeiformis TaxID=265554 RepID=A0A6S8PQS7_9STRA|mmetsp:Transcript_11515/g.21918  ORF Transcript_11515/g.21918 Transcript_11515/m.21918 type:complete len:187 (-) Transcript_11515:22-582(-)
MGRPRELFMTRILRRSSSNASFDDKATQCVSEHVRKLSEDSASVCTDLTQSERTMPQHLFESERSFNEECFPHNTPRRVGFGNVEVRQYEQVIGDHPHCHSGCPLALGWDYREEEPEPLCDYENNKDQVRKFDELRLSDEERRGRLLANEVPDAEIRRCLRRLHRERECSKRCHLKAKAQFFCVKK